MPIGEFLPTFIVLLVSLNPLVIGLSNRTKPIYRWGQWSNLPIACSTSCGIGVRCQFRNCLDGFGQVQISNKFCLNTDYPTNVQTKLCTPCMVNAHCPRISGWSVWNAWSQCTSIGSNQSADQFGCQIGTRIRLRFCNHPPPEPPPFGIPCGEINQQIEQCNYNCPNDGLDTNNDKVDEIKFQVERDYQYGLKLHKQVRRERVNQFVQFDCATEAYNRAKKLTTHRIFGSAKQKFKFKKFNIRWFKNGLPIVSPTYSGFDKVKTRFNRPKILQTLPQYLIDEESKWISRMRPPSVYIKDTYLIIPNVQKDDQGFYTCQLTVEDSSWIMIFYSLIVIGVEYAIQISDSFYLHSNLGINYALIDSSLSLESAQIVWFLNGQEYSRGLALRPNRRVQLIPSVNLSHQGSWRCFFYLTTFANTHQINGPWNPVIRHFLINEFYLKVIPTETSLWRLADYSPNGKQLRNISVSFAFVNFFLILSISLTIWTVHRWVGRTLSLDQKKAIVQELVDDQCRLLLVARKRAEVNRHLLTPLIRAEHERLEQVNQVLCERYKRHSI